MKTSIANSKSPRSNQDVQCPTMETAQIKATLLEERSLHFNRSLRVVHRLLRGLYPRIRTPSPAAVFLQPFKSNFIPDPEGTISFALSPLLRDLFEVALLPACDISLIPWVDKGLGLTGHLRYLGFHIEKWRVRPQKHITWE